MRLTALSFAILPLVQAYSVTSSPKRGIVYVAPEKSLADNKIWTSNPSSVTWYYNYVANPTEAFAGNGLEFVPMLWGLPSDVEADTTFLDAVTSQMDAGANITHVLGFNEPDGQSNTGGSNIGAEAAAKVWKKQMEPLKKKGVMLGAPAVTGSPNGMTWLENFFTACDNCTVDFIPVHWYGNFEGLASHIGQVRGTYPNKTIWVTEYALANAELVDAQGFYNISAEYFDRLDYVDRYSYFGSFRSDVSNVGPNAAMLDQDGKLTDIGAWYLGRPATGNVPKGRKGQKGDAGRIGTFAGWSIFILAATFSTLA